VTVYSAPDLDRFRSLQRLAYDAAQTVAGWLGPGVTERQAAARLRAELSKAGVDDFFHVPFAWFGDRTAFRGFRTPVQFFPTGRALTEGMPYILDCAPIADGYTADIGYAGCLGTNRAWSHMAGDLRLFRSLIRDEVQAGTSLWDVYAAVDALIVQLGYDNRHRVYPGRVIGHRVSRLASASAFTGVTAFGFGVRTLQTLGREFACGRSPLWADGRAYRHRPSPGLWAVEPHIGLRGVGLKFEELLVVTEDDAYWLDDDLPHVRRWS
jgi:hypothetical protein